MPSLKKRNGSKYYTACFTDESGKRRQRTTGTADKVLAQEIADKLERRYRLKQQGEYPRELYSLLEPLDQRELSSNFQVKQVASSFTGMPPEADLEIRIGFSMGVSQGGGSKQLFVATRLLAELERQPEDNFGPNRSLWLRSWAGLGNVILKCSQDQNRSISKILRSVAEELEKGDATGRFDPKVDTNEARLFWYLACYFKRYGCIAPRRAINSDWVGSGASETTLNRLLGKWTEICRRYQVDFEFPKGDREFPNLSEFFKNELDLIRGRSIYWRIPAQD